MFGLTWFWFGKAPHYHPLNTDLLRLRAAVFDPTKHSNLKLVSTAGINPVATTTASISATTAPPPPPPPPGSPADIELERRRSCCLMLARGTHARYGMFSPVLPLAGNRDLLQRICMLADISTAVYIPAAPPPERVELHRHLRCQLANIHHLRDLVDELHIQLDDQSKSAERSARQAEYALAQAASDLASQIRRADEADARAEVGCLSACQCVSMSVSGSACHVQ